MPCRTTPDRSARSCATRSAAWNVAVAARTFAEAAMPGTLVGTRRRPVNAAGMRTTEQKASPSSPTATRARKNDPVNDRFAGAAVSNHCILTQVLRGAGWRRRRDTAKERVRRVFDEGIPLAPGTEGTGGHMPVVRNAGSWDRLEHVLAATKPGDVVTTDD